MRWLYVLGAAAIIGVGIALFVVFDSSQPAPVDVSAARVVAAPFASYVAGTGITETGRGNIAVGSAVSGVVSAMLVRVGDRIAVGDPLFRIDDRQLQARLVVARAEIGQAEAALAKPRHRLDFLSHLQQRDREAISREAISSARDELASASAAVVSARANLAQIEVDQQRLLVRAPSAGRVLQVNVRVGEFAASDAAAKPLVLLGDDRRMYLRLDVDENDAWRVRPEARARGYVRGNPGLLIPLRFEYIEPYVTAKTALSGQSTERSDLRVLQVLYSFDPKVFPVYLGQQMDAFIEAAPVRQDAANGRR